MWWMHTAHSIAEINIFPPHKWKIPVFLLLFLFECFLNTQLVLNVCVLSALSNEINCVKRAFSYRKSYVFLERVFVWFNEAFRIWCGNITRKDHPCFEMAVNLMLKFGTFALIFLVCFIIRHVIESVTR